ncbi:MAG TPA: hypothetical protein VLC91_04080 [Spongiibacteraceae bacterium]|nr:hypothetical protein [Spongiibacteraceae bacterium]
MLYASWSAGAAERDACSYLAAQFAPLAAGPVLLASFPTVEEGPLHASAFLYDNAAATVALVGCGQLPLARRIGDAILIALDNDRFWHDGRLRNSYLAGALEKKVIDKKTPIKLGGWWDKEQQRWLEDRYQVGSDNGNMAWAMLALLAIDKAGTDAKYRAGAIRIGQWVASQRDTRGVGGFTGGTFAHEPQPSIIRWKSTEHNTDLAAAFAQLAQITGDQSWRDLSSAANQFVAAMWDSKRNCFNTGTGDDGVKINPFIVLDAQIWPLLALPGATQRYVKAIDCAHEWLSYKQGYAYSEVRDGVWTEGSAQALLLMKLLGRNDDAARLQEAIAQQRTQDGAYYASSISQLPTGFMLATDPSQPRLYYRLPHLGALAWVALAERRFNPFTGTTALPDR